MRILAIETSCDDTGIAILDTKDKSLESATVLSNIVSSQINIHQQYGGVFPMMAQREHQKNIVPVLMESLKKAGLLREKKEIATLDNDITITDILKKEAELLRHIKPFLETYEKPAVDAIAVTHGPGLEPCLWVGVNFARVLSYVWDIPLIPVNHIEAHILVNLLQHKEVTFPAISLVVSGGHTQLILVKSIGDYEIIGETRDDAAGECFDKAAKILGLGYPGGPIVSKIASEVQKSSFKLPRPMMTSKDYDFSFSGLKTAVLYTVRDNQEKITDKNFIQEMCFEVQQSILDVLIKKTLQAAHDHSVKTIILGGGVSANSELKKRFENESPIPVIYPERSLSTDNGLMIAVAGFFNREKQSSWKNLQADANLRVS